MYVYAMRCCWWRIFWSLSSRYIT